MSNLVIGRLVGQLRVPGQLRALGKLRAIVLFPGAIAILLSLGAPACTDYRVVPRDAGSGGATATGGTDGGPSTSGVGGAAAAGADGGHDGGTDVTTAATDAGADHPDAPITDTPTGDAGVDLASDTGPTLLANGASCRAGTDCQFGNCVDGVCCESACSGQCQACAEPTLLGKCVTVTGAVRGISRSTCAGQGTCASTCNGSDSAQCHYPGSEKQCAPASCSAGVARAASTCNGAGACSVVSPTNCVSNLCADGTQCAGGCSATQPCATTQYCQPGVNTCQALKANGDTCVQGLECTSRACVDGVCCESACNGECEACGETGSKGRCIAVSGAPRGALRPPCAGVRDACRGTCDGVSRTQCNYPGATKQCVPASCSGGTSTTASVCNTLGDCTTPASAACGSGQCSTTGLQCLVCSAGLACAGGLVCSGNMGVCVAQSGLSIAPVTPASFASTPIGQASASQTLTVTNTGGVPAGSTTGLVASLSGTDAGDFRLATSATPCTGALAAAAHCTVVVTFNPSSAGGKTATLTVTGAPGGSVSVPLTGAGLRRLGDTCVVAGDCPAGSCVDGHCCATPSCGICQSCTGASGTCAPIINAIDRDSCVGGTCDSAGTCKPPGSILWARSTSKAWLYSAIEGPGGVVTIGTITAPDTANLGGSALMPVGATDSVLGQFATSDAAHLASSRFGGSAPLGTGNVYALGGILDATGTPIVRGTSYCDPTAAAGCNQVNVGGGLADPGGGPGADSFVGRYVVGNGVPSWLATLKGPADDKIVGSTNGPGGTIFVAGWYNEGVGANTTLTSGTNVLRFGGAGDRDILVAQLNPSTGAIGMTRTFAGPGFEEALSVAWTGSNIIVAGDLAGPAVSFGAKSLASVGDFDIWVAKLAPADGTPVWAVQLGGAGRDVYPYITVDSIGDVYVTGTVGAPTNFGGFPVGGAGGLDIFVAKLRNTDGSIVWAKSLGSTGDDGASGIAVRPSGQIAITGTISGPLQVGGPGNGASDVVVASFTADGVPLWTKVLGTSGMDYGGTVTSGPTAFYVALDLGAGLGPTIEGVPIVGAASPVGLLLKIQP
jgi:hypothetical protein